MNITLIIIIFTAIISIYALQKEEIMDKLIFSPTAISQQNQWYRFISSGFIHADLGHLFFNMYSFYSFGGAVEDAFETLFGPAFGKILYIVLYITAIIISSIPSFVKNKDNYFYRSLGASGAVSAIVFAFIMLSPTSKIGLMFIPIGVPSYIFGLLFLVISSILDKRGGGNINHSAHIFGGIYGALFITTVGTLLGHINIFYLFLSQIAGN